MNLKQLEAFVQVAEEKSFSKAAKQLYLTQPTVSAHIASLEKELGESLFIRDTKGVGLSEAGRELYGYARQMMAIERKIQEHFEYRKRGRRSCILLLPRSRPSTFCRRSWPDFEKYGRGSSSR